MDHDELVQPGLALARARIEPAQRARNAAPLRAAGDRRGAHSSSWNKATRRSFAARHDRPAAGDSPADRRDGDARRARAAPALRRTVRESLARVLSISGARLSSASTRASSRAPNASISPTPASRLRARCCMRSRRRRTKTCTPRCPIWPRDGCNGCTRARRIRCACCIISAAARAASGRDGAGRTRSRCQRAIAAPAPDGRGALLRRRSRARPRRCSPSSCSWMKVAPSTRRRTRWASPRSARSIARSGAGPESRQVRSASERRCARRRAVDPPGGLGPDGFAAWAGRVSPASVRISHGISTNISFSVVVPAVIVHASQMPSPLPGRRIAIGVRRARCGHLAGDAGHRRAARSLRHARGARHQVESGEPSSFTPLLNVAQNFSVRCAGIGGRELEPRVVVRVRRDRCRRSSRRSACPTDR